MKQYRVIFGLVVFLIVKSSSVFAQSVCFIVKDRSSQTEPLLPGVAAAVDAGASGSVTGADGKVLIEGLKPGIHTIEFSLTGYQKRTIHLMTPQDNRTECEEIWMIPFEEELEEVVVTSTRVGSRIEDANTKIEVIGQEDLEEEASIVPGNVSSLLGDLAVITVQRTSQVNGNDAIRMQGLDARYTQLMRDGLPLYGGFSGSLGVLSIPPLDLKRIEIIKGSASTLYGGGAVSGLINFISKEPEDSMESTVMANISSLKEKNLNGFTGGKSGKFGWTHFGGANIKSATDVNGDGFTEVPDETNISLHPRFFYAPSQNISLQGGYTGNWAKRTGGDVTAVRSGADVTHPYIEYDNLIRNTVDVTLNDHISDRHQLVFKAALSSFERNYYSPSLSLNGEQSDAYAELSDCISWKKHKVVVGVNYTGENYRSLSVGSQVPDHDYNTLGVFVEDDWQLHPKLSVETGFRVDHHSFAGTLLLPRISVLYNANDGLSFRMAAGTGYKLPQLFDFFYPNETFYSYPAAFATEHSYGSNFDCNYHTLLFGKLGVQIDQAFYYSYIVRPAIVQQDANGYSIFQNDQCSSTSIGTDTYIRLRWDEIEGYVGFNHTLAKQQLNGVNQFTPFNPKDKFSATLMYHFNASWRAGYEMSNVSHQYIYNGRQVHDYWFSAMMIGKKTGKVDVVLNGENLFNIRQSDYSPVVTGTTKQPVFAPVWAPLEGRVINLSVSVTF